MEKTSGPARLHEPFDVPEALRLPVLEDLPDLRGARVLLRCDFNVPLDNVPLDVSPSGTEVADDFRLRAVVPTIAWLHARGAAVTACSHLGRPGGAPDPRFSMEPVRRRLAEIAPGVELLDNLRFDPGEEANDPAYVQRLVRGYDAYVNDAFGASHRNHASIVGPPSYLPSAAGRLMAREVSVFGGLLGHPHRPYAAVIGGAKVADKIGLLSSLSQRVESLVIGGGMAFTFLAALGHRIGSSLFDPDQVASCKELLDVGRRVLLPTDVVALAPGAPCGAGAGGRRRDVRVVGRDIPEGWRGVDIGPGTVAEYTSEIADAATVFWNGPMGVFEDDRFAAGTEAVARAVAGCHGFAVAGGGETASALDHWKLADGMGFVSTGGGASLALLEHGDLPGIAALRAAHAAAREAGDGS